MSARQPVIRPITSPIPAADRARGLRWLAAIRRQQTHADRMQALARATRQDTAR